MRNFPIGRYPLAEAVWRAHLGLPWAVSWLQLECNAQYINRLDDERLWLGIPSIFDYTLSRAMFRSLLDSANEATR